MLAMLLIRGRVDVVDDAKGLLPVLVRCCVVCRSQLTLPLPLSDPILVVVAVVFWLHLTERASW